MEAPNVGDDVEKNDKEKSCENPEKFSTNGDGKGENKNHKTLNTELTKCRKVSENENWANDENNEQMTIDEEVALADYHVEEVEIQGSGDLTSDVEHTETGEKSKIVCQFKTPYTSKVLQM